MLSRFFITDHNSFLVLLSQKANSHKSLSMFNFSSIRICLLLFIGLFLSDVQAQSPIPVPLDSVRFGDEVVFSKAPDAKRFILIGKDADTYSCSVLNEGGALDTIVVRKITAVAAFKNSLNRKRLSMFHPGTKLRWRQGGKRVEGFLKSYSPADPELTVEVYTNTKLEDRRVPVKYATPTFMESMADTMQWLCKVWEAPDQLFSFTPDETVEQGIPRMGHIKMKTSAMGSKVQYVMEGYKFAMVFADNTNHGIVGTWRTQDELLIVSTKMASMTDASGERKAVPAKGEYRFEWQISDDGNTLKLDLIDWDFYEEKWRLEAEAKAAKEKAERELAELQKQQTEQAEQTAGTITTGDTPPPPPVRIDKPTRTTQTTQTDSPPVTEVDILKKEIELLKLEIAKMKAEMKEKHGG